MRKRELSQLDRLKSICTGIKYEGATPFLEQFTWIARMGSPEAVQDIETILAIAQNGPPEGVADGTIDEELWKLATRFVSRYREAHELALLLNQELARR